jgi:hypothetical protein
VNEYYLDKGYILWCVLAISVALLVASSSIDVIPILSAPILTPAKKLSQPRPSMARIIMATGVRVRIK